MAYFLISVSNRENLSLCIKYGLAGFTNSINGAWSFCELNESDFVSFLYGAKAFNLYKVKSKMALKNAGKLPPWPPITFKMSGKTYFFPFRVNLELLREFEEPLVRAEFAYVAENLLLRGGYRKTHFQADQTTLQSASQMGSLTNKAPLMLKLGSPGTFTPLFTKLKKRISVPEVLSFQEIILQSLIRQHLSKKDVLDAFLSQIELGSLRTKELEVLGEKALMEGHIDILIKEAVPKGIGRKIIIEVKSETIAASDVAQIKNYLRELGDEAVAGVLIARKFAKNALEEARREGLGTFEYTFSGIDLDYQLASFKELKNKIGLNKI